MTNLKEIYKCDVCNNIVEILQTGNGQLVCCEQAMNLQERRCKDSGFEKHVPVLEKQEDCFLVTVGENPHPMEQEHFIEWIEVILKDGKSCRLFLGYDDSPEAIFSENEDDIFELRAYCNVHGLWVQNFCENCSCDCA